MYSIKKWSERSLGTKVSEFNSNCHSAVDDGNITVGKIPGYIDGGYSEEPDDEDDGLDQVGDNPTGRKRKSSARTRRKKIRRLFKGTDWDPDKK